MFSVVFLNHLTVRGSQEVMRNIDTTQTAISYPLTHCLISKLSGLAISWRNERSVGKIHYGLMHHLLTTKHASIWSQDVCQYNNHHSDFGNMAELSVRR